MVALGLLAALAAQADDQSGYPQAGKAFIDGQLGYSSASYDIGGGLAYGVEGGYYLSDLGFGAFLRSGNHSGNTDFTFGAEALYALKGLLPGLSVGAQVASVKFSGPAFPGDFKIGLGGKVDYDFPISSSYPLTVGASLGLMWSSPAGTVITMFNPMVFAKLWF